MALWLRVKLIWRRLISFGPVIIAFLLTYLGYSCINETVFTPVEYLCISTILTGIWIFAHHLNLKSSQVSPTKYKTVLDGLWITLGLASLALGSWKASLIHLDNKMRNFDRIMQLSILNLNGYSNTLEDYCRRDGVANVFGTPSRTNPSLKEIECSSFIESIIFAGNWHVKHLPLSFTRVGAGQTYIQSAATVNNLLKYGKQRKIIQVTHGYSFNMTLEERASQFITYTTMYNPERKPLLILPVTCIESTQIIKPKNQLTLANLNYLKKTSHIQDRSIYFREWPYCQSDSDDVQKIELNQSSELYNNQKYADVRRVMDEVQKLLEQREYVYLAQYKTYKVLVYYTDFPYFHILQSTLFLMCLVSIAAGGRLYKVYIDYHGLK